MRDKCAKKYQAYQCNNELQYNWEPCHTKKGVLCPEGFQLTDGNCSDHLSDVWKCGDKTICTEVYSNILHYED